MTSNLKLLLAVAVATLFLRVFVFEGFLVSGDSMSPTIVDGDYVLIEKITYRLRKPGMGDIVVAINKNGQRVIKRITGVPGDIVKVQGKDWNMDPEEYFLEGDNTETSIDSEEFGTVDAWNIKGRVFGDLSSTRLKYLSF